jgi:HlyD family secretion protein
MTMTVRARRLILAAAAIAVAGAAAIALRPAGVPAEAVAADSGPVCVTVDWTGKTRVRDRYRVSAPVSGQLQRLELRAGDRVHAGQVVARIGGAAAAPLDPRRRAELEARLHAARAAEIEAVAAQRRAEAAAALARREAERAESLRQAGSLSAQGYEATAAEARVRDEEQRMAAAAARRAEAEVAAAQAALGAGARAGRTVEVRSPVEGAVLRALRESAGPVAGGTPLLELGDPADLEVVLDLPTADAVRVHPGDQAVASAWAGGAPLAAVVRRVEPSAYTKVSPLGVEEQRVDVVLDPSGPGWSALGDGFSVDVQVVVQELPEAVRVPTSALFRHGNGWALYAVVDGRARRRSVEVAARGDGAAAIREGVRPGDVVLVHPSDELADGVRVTLR